MASGSRKKVVYVCADCGADHPKWQGQCAACEAWNTLAERQVDARVSARPAGYLHERRSVTRLDAVTTDPASRISSGFGELDRVLGGGLVPGSVVLLGGSPGAGKSTLLLQAICGLAVSGLPVLYVTGEESLSQVAMRAQRLGLDAAGVDAMAETDVEVIIGAATERRPSLLVVDSIQVMMHPGHESAPGSVAQVRETAALLVQFAKQQNIVVIMVGHVTKEGSLAGPRVLEHMIDAFLMLDGEADARYRTLRSHKNRFGAVNELGVFAMTGKGMKEVRNPSAIFLSRSEEAVPGSTVLVLWEGTRPMLVELQALVDDNGFGQPRRVALGVDHHRLAMLLAVLSRHGGLSFAGQDVYVNVVGGIRVAETSSDLAVLAALVSSFRNRALPQDLVVFGEVGLSGEVRPVPNGQERLAEAVKHGFSRALVARGNQPARATTPGMQVTVVARVAEVLDHLQAMMVE